jgi:LPS O-antigen subunit length determinant protein (WzzB/FepE family)
LIKENDTYLEEEIDLRELFKIIWDRKVFIIVFTLVVTIIAGLYTYLKIPIFEVKSHVELGYINKEKLEDIDSLEQKLKVIFSVEDMKFEKDSFEKGIVTSIKQVKAVKNFLEIKTEALSNEAATAKNKEVLKFIQELSSEKIKEHEILFENTILNTQREIDFINNIEMKNISSQIEILKEQEIKSIDREIEIIKNQNIKNIDRQINLLKTQEIPALKTNINFLTNSKTKSLEEKINYYSKSLQIYISELDKLNKSIEKVDTTSSMIASVQMLNYQNLITNAQNQIKDLELQVEIIRNETIPKLKYNLENITTIQIKDLQDKKENITTIQIKDLENKKANVSNEIIRKLEDKINIELQTKISQLNEKVDIQKLQNSEQNITNTKLVGEYIIRDYPIKPKKLLIIVVAFVTGFILSIFLVFFLQFIRKD